MRRLLFLSFLTFFLISAPLIVLYTAGYRYSPRSGLLLQTGVLSLHTIPRNASISIDNRFIGKTTPFVLKRMVPGNYTIRLERKDYLPWETEIAIKPGSSTFLQNILLLRDDAPAFLTSIESHNPEPSPNANAFLYTFVDENWQEVRLFDVTNTAERVLTRIPSAELQKSHYKWSTNGTFIALNSPSGIMSLYLANGNALSVDTLSSLRVEDFYWHPSSDHILYLQTSETVYEVLVSSTISTVTALPTEQLSLSTNRSLAFTQAETETQLREFTGDTSRVIALLPRGEYRIIKQDGSFLLIQKNGGNLLLLNLNGNQPILLSTSASINDWQKERDILAYSNGNEVNVYQPSTHQVTFLTRISEQIHFLAWHPTTQYVFFSTDKTIEALELYKSSKDRRRITVAEADQIQTMWLSTNGKTLYFIGAVGENSGLFSRSLIR